METAHTLHLATQGLVRICLYGDLQRFGQRFKLHVRTAAEGIRALCVQLPEMRSQLQRGCYQVRITGRDVTAPDMGQRIHEALPEGAVVHIVPRAAGAKHGGAFQVILGAALIAVAWWNPAGWLGASAISASYAAGASMVFGGVVQLLTPVPKTPLSSGANNGKQNTYFSSLENMAAQGSPLPVLYGEMQIGSRRISQELCTRDMGGDGALEVRIGS
ncbi:tail assembly protein [Edwardsiella tarda]